VRRWFVVLVAMTVAATMIQSAAEGIFAQEVSSGPTLYGDEQNWARRFVASLEIVDGDLWVDTYGGLCRLDADGRLIPLDLPDTVRCAIGPRKHAALKRIPPYQIHSMRQDPFSRDVWIGLNDDRPCAHGDYAGTKENRLKPGGILRFDEASGSWLFYPPTRDQVSARTYSIAFDSASVWVWGRYPLDGSEKAGVYRHDRATGGITFIPADLGYEKGIMALNCGLPSDLLTVFNNRLWFGQAQLVDQKGIWASFDHATKQANRDVSVVKADGRLLWLGYNNGVIIRYSPDTGTWDTQELPLHVGAITCFAFTDSLVLASVGCEEWDPKERLRRNSGGLLVLDRQRGAWGYVSSFGEIPSMSINTFLLDGDTLWIGGNGGLIKWSLPGLLSEVERSASEPETSADQSEPGQ
jgi:hypothetical protein